MWHEQILIQCLLLLRLGDVLGGGWKSSARRRNLIHATRRGGGTGVQGRGLGGILPCMKNMAVDGCFERDEWRSREDEWVIRQFELLIPSGPRQDVWEYPLSRHHTAPQVSNLDIRFRPDW